MPHKFTLNPESLKRELAVYVVISKGVGDAKLYVGKTGHNREGCNPPDGFDRPLDLWPLRSIHVQCSRGECLPVMRSDPSVGLSGFRATG